MNASKRHILKTLRVLLILAAGSGLLLRAGDWTYEIADTNGGGGVYSTLRVDANNNAHTCHWDSANSLLKYSFRDNSRGKWFTATLDSSTGFCSLTLDSKQRPHVSYIDHGTLKYAFWDGSAWIKKPIPIKAKQIDYYTSITLNQEENPTISYYEYWGTGTDFLLNLRNVTWMGSYWAVRTVDATAGSGKFNSIALDSKGTLHIAYANVRAENASLRYAHWNGEAWDVEILEGADVLHLPVYSVTLVLDRHDNPHIAYTDVRNRLVKYATKVDGKWRLQVVDTLVQEGYPDRNGLALDDQDHPYISYFDAGAGRLKLAHKSGDKWVAEIVDRDFAGLNSSLQIAGGSIWLSYADETGRNLKSAHRSLEAGPREAAPSEAARRNQAPPLGK